MRKAFTSAHTYGRYYVNRNFPDKEIWGDLSFLIFQAMRVAPLTYTTEKAQKAFIAGVSEKCNELSAIFSHHLVYGAECSPRKDTQK